MSAAFAHDQQLQDYQAAAFDQQLLSGSDCQAVAVVEKLLAEWD